MLLLVMLFVKGNIFAYFLFWFATNVEDCNCLTGCFILQLSLNP